MISDNTVPTGTAPHFDAEAALEAAGIPTPEPIATPFEKIAEGLTDAIEGRYEVVNPKEGQGALKAPIFSVFPRWVSLIVGRVMATGAAKYGKFNYRDSNIAASTYEDAMERHAQLWFDGEDTDNESGVSHLAHVIACATLLLDAQATGRLVDDRQKTGIVRRKMAELDHISKTIPLPSSKR